MSFSSKGLRRSAAILLCLPLLSLSEGRAQELTIGPRAGFQASSVRFQDPNANEQTQFKKGFHVGAALSRPLKPFLEVEVALLLSQGGFRRRGGGLATLNTTHLELPIVFRLHGPWRFSPHLTAGIATRVRVRCRLSDVGIVGDAGCDDPVVGSDWKRWDLVGVAGMGVGWKMGPGFLLIEGLANMGLSNINNEPLPPGWARNADLRFSTSFGFRRGDP